MDNNTKLHFLLHHTLIHTTPAEKKKARVGIYLVGYICRAEVEVK